MSPKHKVTIGRRQFLAALGTGALAAAVVAPVEDAQADSESGIDKRRSRYGETEHIKTYYRVNRYPN